MEPEPKSNSAVKLTIAVGKSRFDKDWKNTEMTWNELKEKLSHTTKTRETLAEFKGMSKARQDSIKDVGGFVGGTLKNGRRKAESVAWRQVVTLDMDEAPNDFADYIRSVLAGKEYLVYGTHKDGPNNRRLRLVFPLSRAVTPDQYQAIARRVAADVKIDFFDDTTYQPHRLMYWPSTPSDVDYYFEAHTGAWVDADEVLARYEDWSDQTQWPESSRVFTAMKKHAEKQEDPYGKKGLIGAFCRAYPIEAAIEKFLPGVYVKCGKDRYTYAEGSTSGGAIVYDGKFLYSHHATDPVSEQLVNAFDLVRIHKFRTMQKGAEEEGSIIARDEDDRITRVGRMLRRCRLDELPQLIDVLKGDMSFVGPRPQSVVFVKHFSKDARAVFLVPAGITSETTLQYMNEGELLAGAEDIDEAYIEKVLPEKMRLQLEEIKNFSLLHDLKTLFKTVL